MDIEKAIKLIENVAVRLNNEIGDAFAVIKKELELITYYKNQLERAKNYIGVEAWPCPLCEYKDEKFIKYCEPHRQLEECRLELEEILKKGKNNE